MFDSYQDYEKLYQKSRKHPDWFREWQLKFYNSKEWRNLRDQIRVDRKMVSDFSGQFINGRAVVDHIIEITPENYTDPKITLNPDNLQLLSHEEHNMKTFSPDKFNRETKSHFTMSNRVDSIF